MAKEPWVDRSTCIGCGTCCALVPKVFALDDDGKSVVIDPNGADEAEIQAAIDACPVNCIHWREGVEAKPAQAEKEK